jgi:acetyl-CoA carboxylase carboxyltransferase component
MGCSKMGPDFIFGWPTVEFAPTGPESIVQAIFHKELAKAKEEGGYEELYGTLLGAVKEQFSVMNLARFFTTYYTVHEVIDPRATREHIIKALHASAAKREEFPSKKRWVKPA